MTINGSRRVALILLASCAASSASAQTGRAQNGEFVILDRPAAFDLNPNSGSLKESVQKGQELVWHPKDKPNEARFKVTNMSVAFLRSESGGQVKMTFTGNISSLGYLTGEEAKLNAIAALLELRHFGQVRRQGSAADASDARRAQRPRAEHLRQCQHGRNCGTGRAEFPRGEGSTLQLMTTRPSRHLGPFRPRYRRGSSAPAVRAHAAPALHCRSLGRRH